MHLDIFAGAWLYSVKYTCFGAQKPNLLHNSAHQNEFKNALYAGTCMKMLVLGFTCTRICMYFLKCSRSLQIKAYFKLYGSVPANTSIFMNLHILGKRVNLKLLMEQIMNMFGNAHFKG